MESELRRTFTRRDFLRVAGASSVMLAVAACATPSQPAAPAEGGEAAPAAETVVLRIQANPDQESPVMALYRESVNSNVDGEYISITGIDHEEVAAKMLSMLAAGEQVDLGFAATEATQLYAGKGLAMALDEYVKASEAELQDYFSDVHPSLNEAMMWEGSLYQLSRDFNAANMYYNTAAFEGAGFGHPDASWTKDDFYQIASAIASGGSDSPVYGYAWINRLWGSWMPWIFVNGGNILTEERAPGGEWLWDTFYADDPAAEGRGGGWRWLAPQANDPANVEALEFMVQLFDEGITPAVELGGGVINTVSVADIDQPAVAVAQTDEEVGDMTLMTGRPTRPQQRQRLSRDRQGVRVEVRPHQVLALQQRFERHMRAHRARPPQALVVPLTRPCEESPNRNSPLHAEQGQVGRHIVVADSAAQPQ